MSSYHRNTFNSDGTQEEPGVRGSLKVLIVDDEPTVHDITALVLRNFQYKGYSLQLVSAYSATEAREILSFEGPFALILLDVIMETDDAGLGLARFVREELKDPLVRIILRTGQPGMVPQKQVMRDYEIDDYKEKAELTSERFDATVTASIRTFLGFKRLDQSRRGLMRILESVKVLESRKFDGYLPNDVLIQLEEVMDRRGQTDMGSLLITDGQRDNAVVTRRGRFAETTGELPDLLDDSALESINRVRETGRTAYDTNRIIVPLEEESGRYSVAYFEDNTEFGEIEHHLVEIYSSQVKTILSNKMLNQELLNTQREIISTLVEVIESRSGETGVHVQRVGEIARLLAMEVGLDNEQYEMLLFAAPLHDIGKVGISDAILKKPGVLTDEEFEEMKDHTIIGHDILKSSRRPVLRLGAAICLEHHEWWNGQGYPRGLFGEHIGIEARICSIADVLDALRSKRVYRDPVSLDDALTIIRAGRETQFDPNLVDIVVRNVDRIKGIYENLID